MHPSRAREVLYDSETILRLVDTELDELRDPDPDTVATSAEKHTAGAAAPTPSPAGALRGTRRPAR